MIIWGSKGKANVIGKGAFYCPRCGTQRAYEHKAIDKYFTLYFIPVFRTKRLAEYVECTFCLTPFELAVLDHHGKNQAAIQSFLKLVKDEVESGVALQIIYQSLIDNGASEESANLVLATATGGHMNQCPSCKFVFAQNLSFCSNCGSHLVEIRE